MVRNKNYSGETACFKAHHKLSLALSIVFITSILCVNLVSGLTLFEIKNQTDGFVVGPSVSALVKNTTDIWTLDFVFANNSIKNYDVSGNLLRSADLDKNDGSPFGLTTNGTDYWTSDTLGGQCVIRRLNSTFGEQEFFNITDEIGTDVCYGITTNGSDFYLVGNADDFLYHVNSTFGNLTDGFEIDIAGGAADNALGITSNGSNFWIADDDDDYIYQFDENGNNVSGGFPVGKITGITTTAGITINTTFLLNGGSPVEFWIASRDFVYHVVAEFIVNTETFPSSTLEGATELFQINITTNGSQVSTANLVYNDTLFSGTIVNTGGNNYTLSRNLVIPLVGANGNATFSWNINLEGGIEINATERNVSVLDLSLDNCGSFTNLIYNFSQFDEATKEFLDVNNTMEIQMNLYDESKTLLLVNFSQTFQETNPAQICLDKSILEVSNFSADVIVKYFANLTETNKSYTVEYHNILNQTIGNSTVPINIKLFSLREEDATAFRLIFRDSFFNFAPNILVQVHRQYLEDNDFKIVEIPLTDSNGQTILNLVRNDIVYNLIMINEAGKVVGVFNSLIAFCQDFTIGDCVINLNADPEIEEVFNRKDNFSISITNLTFNNITEEVSINFITDDLLPKTVSMSVFRTNPFGNRSVCSNSLTAASGLLTCDVSSIIDTDQFLFADIFVEGEFFSKETINLNASALSFETVSGAFYAFLLILLLICLFMEDKRVLLVALGLGWVTVIALGLVKGRFIGTASAGIWILVTIALMLWKLNKEESP